MYLCVDLHLYVCESECVSDLMFVCLFFNSGCDFAFYVLNQPNFCFVSRGPHFSRLASTYLHFFHFVLMFK